MDSTEAATPSDAVPSTAQAANKICVERMIDTSVRVADNTRPGTAPPVVLAEDRLHFDGLDQLVVTFEGFRPVKIDVLVRRVTATNLALQIGRRVEVGAP
jgi:hypothetical protein